MAYLIDTHTLIWATGDPDRLSARVRDIFNSPAALYLSQVSVWEMMLKGAKLRLPCSVIEYVQTRASVLQFALLPLRWSHLCWFERVPRLHPDPFDRLLIAQVQAEKLALISADRELPRYGVPVVW